MTSAHPKQELDDLYDKLAAGMNGLCDIDITDINCCGRFMARLHQHTPFVVTNAIPRDHVVHSAWSASMMSTYSAYRERPVSRHSHRPCCRERDVKRCLCSSAVDAATVWSQYNCIRVGAWGGPETHESRELCEAEHVETATQLVWRKGKKFCIDVINSHSGHLVVVASLLQLIVIEIRISG